MSLLHKHHKIPKHVGGTDDPSNIEELTVEQHAEAHQKLFEQFGRWQDRLAWLGLSKQIGQEELMLEVYRENGRRPKPYAKTEEHKIKVAEGRKRSAWRPTKEQIERRTASIRKRCQGKPRPEHVKQRVREANAETFKIIKPDGAEEIIHNLSAFCRAHDLRQGNMSGYGVSKGYRLKRISCELT